MVGRVLSFLVLVLLLAGLLRHAIIKYTPLPSVDEGHLAVFGGVVHAWMSATIGVQGKKVST